MKSVKPTASTFFFEPELHIAGVAATRSWHELRVLTLLQDPTRKQPSINAYLGARYSRSADSVMDIAREVLQKGTDAAARLEAIFQNYGHKSVGDMADIFLCLEHVPMITAMKLFNRMTVTAGQERSTRYQDFSQPSFVHMPEISELNKDNKVKTEYATLATEYERIMLKQLSDYAKLMEPTKKILAKHFAIDQANKQEVGALQARSFDTARYVLPMGLQTSLGAVMSARNWSELIALLGASQMMIDRELAELMIALLTGAHTQTNQTKSAKVAYIPEADGLIRHTQPNTTQHETIAEALQQCAGLFRAHSPRRRVRPPTAAVRVSTDADPVHHLARHLQLLAQPLSRDGGLPLTRQQISELGELYFQRHNHHHLMGFTTQSGSFAIDGLADLGILKDLNRHRSLERFVPLFHDEINLDEELNRPEKECFFLCDYLQIHDAAIQELRSKYQEKLVETYQDIKSWRTRALALLEPMGQRAVADEFTKYLLPHAHATAYRFYGSIDDLQYLIHLRTRPGGHIAYRRLTYAWLEKLAKTSPFWKPMLAKLSTPDETSRQQFVDRS